MDDREDMKKSLENLIPMYGWLEHDSKRTRSESEPMKGIAVVVNLSKVFKNQNKGACT
jgi:hypothetical protein